jgi:hypothetical protein
MGMTIVTAKIRNNGSMIYCLGDTNLIPGAPAKDVDASYLNHLEVKAAIKKGHLSVIEGGETEDPKAVEDMTVAELKAYATENNIDLGDATKKDDILAAIQKAGE